MSESLSQSPEMPAADLVELLKAVANADIPVWLDGGWAVDALLARQTRAHRDADIALQEKHLSRLREVLAERGYVEHAEAENRPWNFVLQDGHGRQVDVHAFVLNEKGDGIYGPPENGDVYTGHALSGRGSVSGYPVSCIAPEDLIAYHSGYELDADDVKDVLALCEHFNLPVPAEVVEAQTRLQAAVQE